MNDTIVNSVVVSKPFYDLIKKLLLNLCKIREIISDSLFSYDIYPVYRII